MKELSASVFPRVDQNYYHAATRTFATTGKVNVFGLVCLLIRNTTRFIIRIQEAKSEGGLVLDRWTACIRNALGNNGRG